MKRLLLIAVFICVSYSASAQSTSTSGARYLVPCQLATGVRQSATTDLIEAMDQGICVGILRAAFYFTAGTSFCPPNEVTAGQINRVVVQYLEQRPQDQHLHLAELAERAWIAAWPCRNQPQRR